MLCAKIGRNLPSGSGEEVENVKSLRQSQRQRRQQLRRTINKFLSEKLTRAFSSGELKKKHKNLPNLKYIQWQWGQKRVKNKMRVNISGQ